MICFRTDDEVMVIKQLVDVWDLLRDNENITRGQVSSNIVEALFLRRSTLKYKHLERSSYTPSPSNNSSNLGNPLQLIAMRSNPSQ